MKCVLVGQRHVKYTSKNTGELVEGTSMYLVDANNVEGDPSMSGKRCAEVWTRLNMSGVPLGSVVELVYEQVLGSNRSQLVEVRCCTPPNPDQAGIKK